MIFHQPKNEQMESINSSKKRGVMVGLGIGVGILLYKIFLHWVLPLFLSVNN